MISYSDAISLTLEHIQPLGSEYIDLINAAGRVLAEDLHARVDSPSVDVSLKDGFAVHSSDIATASPQNIVSLVLVGSVSAGNHWEGEVQPGQALRILSGAPLPSGADAVVSGEFTEVQGSLVLVSNDADPGRNILFRGDDVKQGEPLALEGVVLFPQLIGFLAAAGYSQIQVSRRPRVAIIATGDEVLAPGEPIVKGKLYASNLVTLAAWCYQFGFEVHTRIVRDQQQNLQEVLVDCLREYDALLTSGGAWSGERDLVVGTLESIGWKEIYHRVRMGPGKAVGFGLFDNKPIFCLPGGPPSNHMAFLQLALPGLLKQGGQPHPGLACVQAKLTETLRGQNDWTQFIHGLLKEENDQLLFYPLSQKSRLQMMAHTEAIVAIPEGQDLILEGSTVQAQKLIL